jgi:hypothetical protein
MLIQPSQYELNKPDDYTRCLEEGRVEEAKTRSASASARARGKRDVAHLEEQAKNWFPR